MLKQLRYSLRILFKHRLYTCIALLGLSVSVASVWFIIDYAKKSYQYDAFHSNHQSVFRLTLEVGADGNTDRYATTGKPIGELMSRNYPEIEAYATLKFHSSIVRVNNEVFKESDFYCSNPGVFEVFTFNFLSGNQEKALVEPNSIVISESLAEKYFSRIDVLGKELAIDSINYKITGVFQDWPKNAHIRPNAIVSSEEITDYVVQDWGDLEHYTYILIDKASSEEKLSDKLEQVVEEHLSPALKGSGITMKFHTQPLNGLYFSEGLIDDVPKGNITYINALVFSAILVLVIAGLNYINLSLTQSTKRSKEISLKKTLGISSNQLLKQSGMESLILSILVVLIATVLVIIFGKIYFEYTGYRAYDITDNWYLIVGILLIIFLIGLSGLAYSGTYLSISNKLIYKERLSVQTFKKILLGLQFTIASVILTVTLTMDKQIGFMKNKDLGFSKEQVLVVHLPDNEELKSRFVQFREGLKNFAGVKNTSLIGGGALPGEENGKEIFEVIINGRKVSKLYNLYRIDENYTELLDIKFASGRNFQSNRIADKENSIIINESLAKAIGWENPIGNKIWCYDKPMEVIGVVKNFHNKSLHHIIEPIVFMFDTNYPSNLVLKSSLSETSTIKSYWGKFFPDVPFSLTYFDKFIEAMYNREIQLAGLLKFFSMISLLLCCMGLFAVFSLNILQKSKEISIRKVLGANVVSLINSLVGNYKAIISIAIGLAIPISWLFLENWLNGFTYRIQLNLIVFILPSCLILVVGASALAYHINKALKTNPIKYLSQD